MRRDVLGRDRGHCDHGLGTRPPEATLRQRIVKTAPGEGITSSDVAVPSPAADTDVGEQHGGTCPGDRRAAADYQSANGRRRRRSSSSPTLRRSRSASRSTSSVLSVTGPTNSTTRHCHGQCPVMSSTNPASSATCGPPGADLVVQIDGWLGRSAGISAAGAWTPCSTRQAGTGSPTRYAPPPCTTDSSPLRTSSSSRRWSQRRRCPKMSEFNGVWSAPSQHRTVKSP